MNKKRRNGQDTKTQSSQNLFSLKKHRLSIGLLIALISIYLLMHPSKSDVLLHCVSLLRIAFEILSRYLQQCVSLLVRQDLISFSAGVAVTMLFVGYAKFKKFQRKSRGRAAELLSKRGVKAVREILRDVPNWILDPEIETVEWLNKFLRLRFWYYISATAADQVRSAIDNTFKSPPKPISSISVRDFSLGKIPPVITGIRFIENTRHELAHIELGIVYQGDPNIILNVQTMTGLGLNVGVDNFYFRGTLRIMLGPLMENPWLCGGIALTLMQVPEVSFGLKIGLSGVGILSKELHIPGLPEIITSYLKGLISESMVFPISMKIPLIYDMLYKDPNNEDPDAKPIIIYDTEKYGLRFEYRYECMSALEFCPLGILTCTNIKLHLYGIPEDVKHVKVKLSLSGTKEKPMVYVLKRKIRGKQTNNNGLALEKDVPSIQLDTFKRVESSSSKYQESLSQFELDDKQIDNSDIDEEVSNDELPHSYRKGSESTFIVCGPIQKLVLVVGKRSTALKDLNAKVGNLFSCFGKVSDDRRIKKMLKKQHVSDVTASRSMQRIKNGKTIGIWESESGYVGAGRMQGSIEATLAWRPVIKDEKALFDHVSHLLRGDDMSPLHSEAGASGIHSFNDLPSPPENLHGDVSIAQSFSETPRNTSNVSSLEYDSLSKSVTHPSPSTTSEGVLSLTIVRGANLIAADFNGTSDPYALVALCERGEAIVQRKTNTCAKTLNPEFGMRFDFFLKNPYTSKIIISVYDEDLLGDDDFLGSVTIMIRDVLTRENLTFNGPLKLSDVNRGEIIVKAVWYPVLPLKRNLNLRRISNIS